MLHITCVTLGSGLVLHHCPKHRPLGHASSNPHLADVAPPELLQQPGLQLEVLQILQGLSLPALVRRHPALRWGPLWLRLPPDRLGLLLAASSSLASGSGLFVGLLPRTVLVLQQQCFLASSNWGARGVRVKMESQRTAWHGVQCMTQPAVRARTWIVVVSTAEGWKAAVSSRCASSGMRGICSRAQLRASCTMSSSSSRKMNLRRLASVLLGQAGCCRTQAAAPIEDLAACL